MSQLALGNCTFNSLQSFASIFKNTSGLSFYSKIDYEIILEEVLRTSAEEFYFARGWFNQIEDARLKGFFSKLVLRYILNTLLSSKEDHIRIFCKVKGISPA
jgi:hypothetical protein